MKLLVTGGTGFLGQNVVRQLKLDGFDDIVVVRRVEYDLTDFQQTKSLIEKIRPNSIIHLAADVGGIGANMSNPGRFFYNNMSMGLNLVENARSFNVQKFVFVSTVCSYPKYCDTPFKEEDIWKGYPEETNAPYGIAKKTIMIMLQSYKDQYGLNSCVLIPTNLYGPNDNFDDDKSHVIPSLIKKIVYAKKINSPTVSCWGSGKATREFLYVEDAARGVVEGLKRINTPDPINLGSGYEISIRELVYEIKQLVGYEGDIVWDSAKPDGQPRRLLDVSRAKLVLDWKSKIDFHDGLQNTINWYISTLS